MGNEPSHMNEQLVAPNVQNAAQKPQQSRKMATAKHPSIEAAVGGLYRFTKKHQAISKIDTIKEYFIISADQEEEPDIASVRLWVKGYDITEDERKKGYLGHVVKVSVLSTGEGDDVRYTLKAEKEDVPLKNHPQRKRAKQKHPDWGHPVMRQIKKGLTYSDVEEARELLMRMHEEFPDISIPLTNKIYIILYSKAQMPPIEKYVLEIKVAEKGGFFIEAYPNTYKRQELPGDAGKKKEKKALPGEAAEVQKQSTEGIGKFTSLVALKKKPK